MNLLGMQSLPPASTAKLVVEVYNGNSILSTQEQYVSTAGETAWEELAIGMTLPPNTTSIVAYMKYEGGTEVYFDDLKIELNAVPVAVVVQENQYYPFGLGMKGLDYTAPSPNVENKFTFNRVERNTSLSMNIIETKFRMGDTQLGRWWQIDPKPTMHESTYAIMGNNPIKNADPLGDTLLTKADHKRANRIERQLNKRNTSLDNKATKLNGKIATAEAKGNTSKADRLRANLGDVNAQKDANTSSIFKLNAIRNDQTQAYTFNQLSVGSTEGGTILRTMNVNGNAQNVIVMNVLSDANAVHELVHAFQGGIERRYSFNLNNADYPVNYPFNNMGRLGAEMLNATLEVEAYKAQYAFNPSSMPSSLFGGVPNSMNDINSFYVGGIMGTDADGNNVPVYNNVLNMLKTIFSMIR
jgi:RHS repeat-associated protein